jgi:aminoglycoside phosphotransferase (APT) family kinase protein
MLNHRDVAGYLVHRGLLSAEDIVDREVVVRDASSRNHNFKVQRGTGDSYLLKQGIGAEGAATVAHEAAMYQMLSGVDGSLLDHVPRFFGYDAEEGVLAVELVAGGEDLRRYHLRHGGIPEPMAASMGRALGRLHRLTGGSSQRAPEHAPWILSIHRPDVAIFRDASSASLDLIKLVQGQEGFGHLLHELRETWHLDALIHYDVKWDNFIGAPQPHSGQDPEQPPLMKLVDWETATYGDPSWDIGSLLSHFLSTWLSSIPVTGETPPERFAELAGYPLNAMLPAIGACWRAYRSEINSGNGEPPVLRATRFAAARLVQTAFETTQMTTALTSSVVLHLQLAFNVLLHPQEAVVHLLGLAPPGEP